MASTFKKLVAKVGGKSSDYTSSTFAKAPEGKLFTSTDAAIDGEDCDHDCESCSVSLPAKWSIDEEDELYGQVNGWQTHVIVATGKTDWVRDVADEKGSIMEAIDKSSVKPSNGKLMISASNIPTPDTDTDAKGATITSVLLLPSFVILDNVRPSNTHCLIGEFISASPTNTTPLSPSGIPASLLTPNPHLDSAMQLRPRPCPHRYLILMCSQKTRDARCGQSAPLLRKEFERHLRPLGLYRDLHDERPGGVGMYFISHVGGHKYAANVFVYRREAADAAVSRMSVAVADGEDEESVGVLGKEDLRRAREQAAAVGFGEAMQCIWLARVRPEDCENIIKYTVLQGKVVKPRRQLRGGFDRAKGLVSW